MLARFTRMIVLGVTAAALASCAPVQHPAGTATHTDDFGTPVGTQQVRDGGALVMGLSNEPDKLDPTTSSSLYTRYVMSSICEKLYDNDSAGKLVPQLATALPTISEDGLTVTIPVRTGIQFADGTPFDAAAVQTSLQRHQTMKTSQRASEMGPIAAIEVADPAHVVVKFKKPFAPFTAALADRAGMIMSPAALAKDEGKNFADHPVCVGPFKFVKRVPQTSIEVVRDPLYYDAKKVRLDKVTYRIITDANIRAANLRSGDIQVADTISPQDVDALAKDPDLRLLQSGSLGFYGAYINIGNVDGVGKPTKQIDTPIAKDPRIRQAFSLATDRKTLVDTVFNNWFEPACSGIVPGSTYATEAGIACPAYDPERAKQLLTEAGVQLPYTVTMQVTNTPDQLRYAQAWQASLAEGGFDLKIVPTEYATLLDVQKRGTYEILYLGWSGRLDPDANITKFLTTGSNGNYAGYSNPELDELFGKAARSTDPAQRAELYGKTTALIQQDNPYVYTYRIRVLTVHSKQVTGIEAYQDGVVRLGKAAFVAGGKS
ncbi:ABC transporter substrate-binding protein [Nocardia brasiliensis]|uniref:ABC transporter substrate-binding protein n=1 Tax=Nocardia brasiliensis TaxID=37326 RepID=UPI0024585B51|nr:ABC transporter substrate-binding protein [Nocardia brasiliensis]